MPPGWFESFQRRGCTNSVAAPLKWFVPLAVAMLITPPFPSGDEALTPPVWIWMSSIVSMFNCR